MQQGKIQHAREAGKSHHGGHSGHGIFPSLGGNLPHGHINIGRRHLASDSHSGATSGSSEWEASALPEEVSEVRVDVFVLVERVGGGGSGLLML